MEGKHKEIVRVSCINPKEVETLLSVLATVGGTMSSLVPFSFNHTSAPAPLLLTSTDVVLMTLTCAYNPTAPVPVHLLQDTLMG